MITRRSVATLAAASLVTLAFPTFAAPKEDPNAPAIRRVLQQYEQALNRSDAAAIVQLYTDDGVQMAPDAPAAEGREAVKSAYEGIFQAISLNLNFTIEEIRTLGPDAALLRSHSAGTLKVLGNANPAGPAAFKELFLLRKQRDGQWKFSHYSFSGMPAKP